jgi:threonine dehydratase
MATRAEGVATRVAYENVLGVLCDAERGLSDFVLVSDTAMERAITDLLRHAHTLAEHAGAAPLAAARTIGERLRGRVVVLVLSGGNLSVEALHGLLGDGDLRE